MKSRAREGGGYTRNAQGLIWQLLKRKCTTESLCEKSTVHQFFSLIHGNSY